MVVVHMQSERARWRSAAVHICCRRQPRPARDARLQIPYGYSPVMAVDEARRGELEPVLTKFMAAAARGWQAFVQEPEASAREVPSPRPLAPACRCRAVRPRLT